MNLIKYGLLLCFLLGCNLGNSQCSTCPDMLFCSYDVRFSNDVIMIYYLNGQGVPPNTVEAIFNGQSYLLTLEVGVSNDQYGFYQIPSSIPCEDGFPEVDIKIGNVVCSYTDNHFIGQSGGTDNGVCPSSIACNDYRQQVELIFNSGDCKPQGADVTFYFSNKSCANGTYSAIYAGDKLKFNIPCEPDMGNTTIVFPGGKTCVFDEDGNYCATCDPEIDDTPPCERITQSCGDDLLQFAEPLLETDCKQWLGSCDINGLLRRTGSVGIGFSTLPRLDTGYKLLVNGGITTEMFRVCTSTLNGQHWWCDYVFEEDYPLLSLEEVNQFIGINKYLPGFKSANKMVQEGGIDLYDITLRQQEKIEEAFLHLIDIDKRVKDLNKK